MEVGIFESTFQFNKWFSPENLEICAKMGCVYIFDADCTCNKKDVNLIGNEIWLCLLVVKLCNDNGNAMQLNYSF